MILSPAQRKSMSKGLSCCNDTRPMIEFLIAIAEAVPQYSDQVAELVTQHQHLQTLCETAIAADDASA